MVEMKSCFVVSLERTKFPEMLEEGGKAGKGLSKLPSVAGDFGVTSELAKVRDGSSKETVCGALVLTSLP